MPKIESFEALKKYQIELQKITGSLDEVRNAGELVRVKVAMGTCSNAAGDMEILTFMTEALEKRGVDAIVTKTGCMGYCYAEPTIEVTLPHKDPIVFGYVNVNKADHIIETYIKLGEMVEGTIPVNYRTVEESL